MINAKKIVSGATLKKADDTEVVTVSAVTGWSTQGGGSDSGINFKLAIDITSKESWNRKTPVVTAVFANKDTDEKVEINEFQIANFADPTKSIQVIYSSKNLDGTALKDTTGYATFVDA